MNDMQNLKIPAHEKWLYENTSALEQVKQGIKNAAKDKLISCGSFSKYVNKRHNK